MPNHDLGTARARVRIDADTRGARLAERALDSFERAIRSISGRVDRFETTLTEMERELNGAAREFRQAEREAKRFDTTMSHNESTIRRVRRETNLWSQDLTELSYRLKAVNHAAATMIPIGAALTKLIKEFRNTNGGAFGFLTAFAKSGGVVAGLTLMTGKFTAMSAALASVTGWRKRVLQLAGSFRSLVYVGSFLGTMAGNLGLVSRAMNVFSTSNNRVIRSIGSFGSHLRDLGFNLDRVAKGSSQVIGGLALMRHGWTQLSARLGIFNRLLTRSPLLAMGLAGALSVIPATLQAAAKGLIWIGNLLKGALDGVKQLSGGFLAIPGAIAMAAAGIGTMKVITKAFSDTFKDIFKAKDVEELAKALAALPPQFKDLGIALAEMKAKFKDLSQSVLSTFTQGMADQVRALTNNYFPVLERSMGSVANSFKIAKDRFAQFLAEGSTVSDLQTIFMRTAQFVNQLSGNMKPISEGFKDIAVVATEFINELAAKLPGVTARFAEWAKVNRENGNLLKWMQDAWRGAKDLASGIKDAAKATWTLLTLFSDRSGENALARFADAMKKFNDTVTQSAADGKLKEIGDYIRGLGTDKISSLVDVFRSFWDMLKEVAPLVKQFSDTFSGIMVPALKATLQVLEVVADVLTQLGGGHILGAILGLAGAFKLLATVFGPLRNIGQIVLGALGAFKGSQNLILGAAGALEKLGPVGQAASNGLLSVGDSVSKFMDRMLLVGAVVAGFVMSINTANDKIREYRRILDDANRSQTEFKDGVRKAFFSDNGTMGKTVMETITGRVADMRSKLEEESAQTISVWDHFTSFFTSGGGHTNLFVDNSRNADAGWWFSDPKWINDIQDAAANAEKAKQAFDRLGLSNAQIADVAASSDTDFGKMVDKLRQSGEGGEEAAKQLSLMRDIVKQVGKEMADAGPGAAKLYAGIDQIANAAGDSETKLNGLKTALQGLGLLQTNEYEAAFNYAKAIEGMGDAAANAVDKTKPLNDILAADGVHLNTNSANAMNLYNALKPVADAYRSATAAGKDANQLWQEMQPNLQGLAQAFGLTVPQIQAIVGQLGVMPKQVDILVNLDGASQITKDMASVVTQLQTWAQQGKNAVNVPILVKDPQAIEREIEKITGDVFNSNATSIVLKTELDPDALAKVQSALDAVLHPPVPLAGGVGGSVGKTFGDSMATSISQGKPAVDQALQSILGPAIDEANKAAVEAGTAGRSFSQNFADGILANLGLIGQAAGLAAAEAADRMPGSPAKKGPLSGQGWSRYAGEAFARDFAAGIGKGASGVAGAANRMAGGAAAGLGPTGSGEPVFLGQLIEIVNFFQHINDAFTRVAETITSAMKFISDPLQKGTFFGKTTASAFGFRRDPNVSDKQLEQQRQDKLQQKLQDSASGSRSGTGGTSLADLGANPTKEQIAGAIAAEAKARGYSDSVGVAAVAAGMLESSLNTSAENQGHNSLFQTSADKNVPSDAASQIQWFFNEMDKLGGPSAAQGDPMKFIADNIEKGGYPGTDYIKFLGDAQKLIDANANNPIATDRITGGAGTGGYGLPAGSDVRQGAAGFPSWVYEIGKAFNLQASTYAGHQETQRSDIGAAPNPNGLNRGIDWWGDPADMERFAQFLMSSGVAEQVIYQAASGSRYGFPQNVNYGGDYGGHNDHVHTRFSQGIDPNGVNQHGQGNAPGPNFSNLSPNELAEISNNTGYSLQTQQQMLDSLRQQNVALDDAIRVGQDPASTNDQIASSLGTIQSEIEKQSANDTPAGRQQLSALEGVKSSIMSDRGFSVGGNPIDTISGIVEGITGMTSDFFNLINAGIETVGATKNIADMLLRGPQNTEDLMKLVDEAQSFISLGAAIAGQVSSVAGTIGGIVGAAGAADPSGGAGGASAALQAVSMIAGFVQAAYETTNAVIDLAQEAYHIVGSYVGQFLGILAGGSGGALTGDVKFLLDQNVGKLFTYGADNPLDKRGHNAPGAISSEGAGQGIGQLIMYGGPGSDPRDLTRQMMWQVKASKFAGVTSA